MTVNCLDGWPAGLARAWVRSYNHFILLAIAQRETGVRGWPAGCLRELLTDAAAVVVEQADQLRALGYPPHREFAGEEADLWAAAVRYVTALPCRPADAGEAWAAFAAAVAAVSDHGFAHVTALQPGAADPDGLARLFAQRFTPPANRQPVGQPLGEVADEPTVLRAGG